MDRVPLHRLAEFIDPTAEEAALFENLRGYPRSIPRRAAIRQQGDPVDQIYFLLDGWAISFVDLPDGQRRIVKVHLPGGVMGAPRLALNQAAETLMAITPVTISSLSVHGFGTIFSEAPRLAAALFIIAQQERLNLKDRITSLGRQSALQRLAALLLHVYDRLQLTSDVDQDKMDWHLTQQHVADSLGLTSVHVSRIFRQLESQGFIVRRKHGIAFPDVEALRRFAGAPEREWVRCPAWAANIGRGKRAA
jgi:CRP-like cAMP-binding protein